MSVLLFSMFRYSLSMSKWKTLVKSFLFLLHFSPELNKSPSPIHCFPYLYAPEFVGFGSCIRKKKKKKLWVSITDMFILFCCIKQIVSTSHHFRFDAVHRNCCKMFEGLTKEWMNNKLWLNNPLLFRYQWSTLLSCCLVNWINSISMILPDDFSNGFTVSGWYTLRLDKNQFPAQKAHIRGCLKSLSR